MIRFGDPHVRPSQPLKSRDRLLTAITVREPDRVPVALSFYPTALPQTGGKDADEQLGTDVRFVEFDPPREQNEFLLYLEQLPAHTTVGDLRTLRTYFEWGYHPEKAGAEPLAKARTMDDVRSFNFPKLLEERRHRCLGAKVRRCNQGDWPSRGFLHTWEGKSSRLPSG